jgi:membrane-bound lytic murein transglycosylase B
MKSAQFLVIGTLVHLAAASPASASIALFTDGRTMKIEGYKLVDEMHVQLTMKNGGAVTVPLSRVDRIVDDEIAPPAIVEEVKKIVEEEGIFPKRSWRYDESHGPVTKSKFDKFIVQAAKKFDVDVALVSAVIQAESNFNPHEISNKGARGLMQLMPATAERFGVSDSYDPEANIYGGVRYLRWLLQTFHGNADLAVAAYNAGEGNVWKYNGVPPFRETINYINRIATRIRANFGEPEKKTSETASR